MEHIERYLEVTGCFHQWVYRSARRQIITEERSTDMASEFYYKLGAAVKDVVTGFKGTVTGRVEYLTGCRQYMVAPKMKDDGTLMEPRWYDEDRIKVDGKSLLLLTKTNDGPDMPAPIK